MCYPNKMTLILLNKSLLINFYCIVQFVFTKFHTYCKYNHLHGFVQYLNKFFSELLLCFLLALC